MAGSGRQRLTQELADECLSLRQEVRELARINPDRFVRKFFKIKTKVPGAPLQPLNYWHPQRVSRALRAQDKKEGRPIRHFYLKSRQVGETTDCAADLSCNVWAMDNYEALIIAHDKKRAGKILLMCHTFFDELPLPLQQIVQHATQEMIRFKDSKSAVNIMTAANFEAGRGDTIHAAQASEFCYYDDPVAVMQALEQLLPMLPGTIGLIETTAQGAGTKAHEFWLVALGNARRIKKGKVSLPGDNPYRGYFHAWQEDPRNVKIFENDREKADWLSAMLDEFPDLKNRAENYKLTPEQLGWYYQTLKEKCYGDELYMCQEYPCDETEAWTSSGTPIFPAKQLGRYEAGCRPGTLYACYKKENRVTSDITAFNAFEELYQGSDLDRESDPYIEVWQRPIPKRRYAIGADGSAGFAKSDFSSAFVYDMFTLEQVAEIHGRMEPADFATVLRCVGTLYNMAIIAPETNGMGLTVLSHLKDKYFNIYMRREETARGAPKITDKMGWETTASSRPQLIINAKRLFLEKAKGTELHSFIRSKHLVRELQTFVQGQNGKPEAAHGCNDDRVFGWAITLVVIFYELYNSLAKDEGALPGGNIWTPAPEEIRLPKMSDVMDSLLDPELRGWDNSRVKYFD